MTAQERIRTALEENGVYAEVYQHPQIDIVTVVEIEWGDWKHDHWRADMVVEELGGCVMNVITTEDDGSDCYSAVHYYCLH